MSSSENFVEYIADLLSPIGIIRTRKMFGEYGLYANEVFFAMVCNDTLYFQSNPELLGKFPVTGIPYP